MIRDIIKNAIKYLIEKIEKYEYRHVHLDQNNISKKTINTELINVSVSNSNGLTESDEIHITQPYREHIIETNSFKLSCADDHVVYKKDNDSYTETMVNELSIGDLILTKNGDEAITRLSKSKYSMSMYDLSVYDSVYYTSGILSHNTISSSLFMLHTIIFNNDKNIMVVANKLSTAIEIVDKIKEIYILLPFFLKPGIITWAAKSLTFENKVKVRTEARSKSPAIGFTIDILYLDEFAHIPNNIIGPYYTAAFPTVSALENSKIIITSTPKGMNLFHDLLIAAEKPEGDPDKNPYHAQRVYWYQVPGRFVTYIRLKQEKLKIYDIDENFVLSKIEEIYSNDTKVTMDYSTEHRKYEIKVFNNENISDEMIRSSQIELRDGVFIDLSELAILSSWKEEAIKGIGGEDEFNQEYDLRFINTGKSLLSESMVEKLKNNTKLYKHFNFPELDRLRFDHSNLLFLDDEDVDLSNLRNEKILISIDTSEGLGMDYSVINIFRLIPKTKEEIESNIDYLGNIRNFFKLQQIGILQDNTISIGDLAELLYTLVFSILDPDNVKVTIELNSYGVVLIHEMPHLYDGDNDFGDYIFTRHKHKAEDSIKKIGLKVHDNKKILVKRYKEKIDNGDIEINHYPTVNEMTQFIRQDTPNGNSKYGADNGHDDIVMTIVNMTDFMDSDDYSDICNDLYDMLDMETKTIIDKYLGSTTLNTERGTDYSTFYSTMNNTNRFNTFNNSRGIF